MIWLFVFLCPFTFYYFTSIWSAATEKDARRNMFSVIFSLIDCWRLLKEPVLYKVVALRRRRFTVADVNVIPFCFGACSATFSVYRQLCLWRFMIRWAACLWPASSITWCHGRLSCARVPSLINNFGDQLKKTFAHKLCSTCWTPSFANTARRQHASLPSLLFTSKLSKYRTGRA